ncbi:MAG TPA: TetR/AcrR family transcriptional regulator [Ignavibacteria bacterium]|nr:TetR/AcrR family transcriptional regulator [Ignavibacteria bacterium]
MKRTKIEAEETSKNILKCAVSLFIENGYDDTSIDSIAEKAGVTKGAIYWHYKDKSSILDAIIDLYDREAIDYIPKILETDVSPLMKIKFFTYSYIPEFSNKKKIANLFRMKSEITNHYRKRKSQPYAMSFITKLEDLFLQAKKTGEIKKEIDEIISALTVNLIITGTQIKYDVDSSFFKKLKNLQQIMDNYFSLISTKKGETGTKDHRKICKELLPELSEY